jgi:hypothetical protein
LIKDEAVNRLFTEYEKAFNALDIEKQLPFFAEHFISAGPKGSIAQNREEFAKMAHQAAEFYTTIGQTSARMLSADETQISKEYSIVKVHWGVTFDRIKDKIIEFDVSYLIQKTGADRKYYYLSLTKMKRRQCRNWVLYLIRK